MSFFRYAARSQSSSGPANFFVNKNPSVFHITDGYLLTKKLAGPLLDCDLAAYLKNDISKAKTGHYHAH